MNSKQFDEYRSFLDGLSLGEFEVLKKRILLNRIRFRDLDVGEVCCPIGEEVKDSVLCSRCVLKSCCPNFKL